MAATTEAYVGRPLPRVEDQRLLTGSGRYAADFDATGQLYARLLRSDVAHGRLVDVDAEAARRRDGVVGVVTAADVPDVRIPIRLFPTPHAERALQPPLARDCVRYVGEPIAVVVAEDPYVAEDACEDISVEIDPFEPLLAPRAADAEGAPVLHPDIGGNVIDAVEISKGGRLDRIFKNAAVVVREQFRVQRHGAVPMETRGLLAAVESEGGVTVWGAAKVKHFNRRILAQLLGMPEERIRFVEGEVGGGFGARGEFYPEDFLIPWLALELGRPVKWVEDRRENLVALNHSREQEWDIEMAADGDGNLLAFRANALFNQGGYVRTHGSVLLPKLMLNHIAGPYRWKGYRASASTVLTNKTPAGTYRGPGQYEPTFVRERMVDLVARELGLDPLEVRRRSMVAKKEMPYDTGLPDVDTGKPVLYDEGDFPLVVDKLLERVGYGELRRDVRRRQEDGEHVGLGVTVFIEMGNPGIFEQALLVPEQNGTFAAHVGVASVGQGVETVLSQVAADALGVSIDRVRVTYQDTAVVPEGMGAFSSRGTVWGGYAISGAVHDLKEKARQAAVELFAAPTAKVEWVDGMIEWKDGTRTRKVPLEKLEIEGRYRYEPEGGSHVLMGANVALVEVEPGSGAVDLQRYAIAYEVGRAINPLTLEGQVRGAAAQGIGGALLEEFAYGPDGQPLATSFMDYALPTAVEIPDIDVVIVELGDIVAGDPVSGAKGAGEGGIIATAATVANAVADAVGAGSGELTSLPVTPETVQRLARARD